MLAEDQHADSDSTNLSEEGLESPNSSEEGSAPPNVSEDIHDIPIDSKAENELRERVKFLEKTIEALESEVVWWRAAMARCEVVIIEMQKEYQNLAKSKDKDGASFIALLEKQKEQIQELKSAKSSLPTPKVFKTYHELGATQQTKVNRDVRETFTPKKQTNRKIKQIKKEEERKKLY